MEMERDKNKQDRKRQTKKKIKSQKKAQETRTDTETHLCTQKTNKSKMGSNNIQTKIQKVKKKKLKAL